MKNLFGNVKKGIVKVREAIEGGFHVLGTPFRKLAATKVGSAVIRTVKIPFIGYLLLACSLNFVLEVLSRHSFLKAAMFVGESPLVYLYNSFIIFVTLSLVLFAKRRVFATIFVCVAWIVSAFANWIVLCFRTTPFSAIDVLMIRNVMTMLDKYMTKWQIVISVVGIALLIALLIYLYIRLPKSKSKRRPFRASAYVCMCIVMVVTLTKVAVETQTVSDNFGNLAYAYNDYGFAYCFSNSIIDVGISKPRDYSEEAVKEIVGELDYDKRDVVLLTREEAEQQEKPAEEGKTAEMTAEDDTDIIDHADETGNNRTEASREEIPEEDGTDTEAPIQYYKNENATREHPNIIIIQLESIFDTKYMKDFYASENPMPTFANLKRRYSSGLFTVPAVGAGTANTEFEVQTGMSTQFFGAGEYPFKTVMRDTTCDSMGYDLKREGYATAGFHNNDATFYERYLDYANLGFDVFAGIEHMYLLNYTPRGWAKDNVLDDIMLERMKQTEGRDYITTITVQAHGRYPKKYTKTLTDIDCYFTGKYADDAEKQAAWRYYINMCKETDDMIADLISGIEEMDEPTVIFMYGDHLPSLNLEDEDLDGINLYQTEWVMWDNIGLEVEKKDMMAYQASTYIFNRLRLPQGLMQSFHNKYMNTVSEEAYLEKLEMLEYDTLYGENYAYDGKSPFPQIEMKMGIRDISVSDYEIRGDVVHIHGEGFNEFSEVYIDGKSVDTFWMNNRTVTVALEEFENGREFYVAQAGDDHVVLSMTNTLSINEAENADTQAEEEALKNTTTETRTEERKAE
ncbi:MAG: LTA synthase family protein [Bacteroidales bacterium]|nr:LTA synthase family protein [Clostridium sp.]MCM1204080.1 LTA synthase family protein [Bacteroidales bacterium]